MRRNFYEGRSVARGARGMAATSHPKATLLALDIMREGGNAVDAGIAAVALLCVIEPHMTGIGGDCFAIYAPGGRNPVGLNGSGRSPRRATLDWYREAGITEIAAETPHSVTVPGAVDAWCRLHGDHGRLPLDRLLAPAIDAAENGYLITDRVASSWTAVRPRIAVDEVSRETLLVNGAAPKAGSWHRQPRLASALRLIASKGRAGFYEGAVAEDIVSRLQELDGLHELDDFSAAKGEYVPLISTDYRGYQVCEIPPNGHGITALMMLNALSAYDLGPNLSAVDRIHLLAEITKSAFRRRDAFIGDPGFSNIPVEALLSSQLAEEMRAEFDPASASAPAPIPEIEHRDTTYLCVVDKDRNALSLINSLFEGFGSGISSRKFGVVLQNRGCSFRLIEGHPNVIEPMKRPMHTIIPGMLCRDGNAVMPFGVMGGHYQPVGHVQLVSNILDRGLDIQDSIADPRTFAYAGELALEPTVEASVREGLIAKGHRIVAPPGPIGGGQAIWIDLEQGALVGGSDPRKDGIALGY
jgi:gamma-glutamyltranspeptidase/glutathione hydrolase